MQIFRINDVRGRANLDNVPFNQSFGYDQFNNLNSRFGSYYYQTSSTDGGTYVNNRRQGWTYHADGQMKHSGMSYDANSNETAFRDWSYDAAGRMERAKDTVTANNSISTYVTVYDGDGQSTREYLQESPVTTNSYMVRSSVWGGKVVSRLDNAGNKVSTIVPVDERLVAVQQVINGVSGVAWTHVDPLGLSQAGDTKSVFDPLGNYVPWQSAPTAPPNAYPPSSPNFGGLGSGFGTSQDRACSLNNLPISCSDLTHQIDVGNVAADHLIMDSQGLHHVTREVVPLGLGMFVMGYPKSDNEGWHWGEIISALPQNPAPTEAQRKCDDKLAQIFGDENAVAAGSGFEPSNMPGKENQFRGGPSGHLNNAMHLYGSEDGYGEGSVFIPAGGRYIGKNPYSSEDSYMFYYSRLGNARNVTLFTAHVDNFSAPRWTTTGRTRVGDIGGEGGRSPYKPNSPFNQGPYIHAHLAIHQGRGYTGKRLSFFNTFCK